MFYKEKERRRISKRHSNKQKVGNKLPEQLQKLGMIGGALGE